MSFYLYCVAETSVCTTTIQVLPNKQKKKAIFNLETGNPSLETEKTIGF